MPARDGEPAPPRAVIWDMDGVLVESGAAHFAAWRRLAQERGRGLAEQEFRRTFGMRTEEILRLLFGDLTESEVRTLAERKEEYFRDIARGQLEARPGARQLVAGLRRAGFRQAVASSAPPANVALTLDVLGLRDAFQAVITGAEVTRGKPDPEVFELAASRLGVPAERCVVVKDAVPGVRAAKAAGMACVAVTGTSTREALREADLVVDSLTELTPRTFVDMLKGKRIAG